MSRCTNALAFAMAACLTAMDLSSGAAAASPRPCTSEPRSAVAVIARSQAFADTLTPTQREVLVLELSPAKAIRWSNLPIRSVPRNGVRIGDLDASQRAAAQKLLETAMSSCGAALFDQIRAADDVLKAKDANRSWDSGNYFVAFLGAPSATAPWILQFGGHHVAFNIAFNSSHVSATPLFDGVEPLRFAVNGRDYQPLARQEGAMTALVTSLAGTASARLDGAFKDVTRGPNPAGDANFPITYPEGAVGRGALYATLSAAQKARVREAMRAWVELPQQAISAPLMREYVRGTALAQTYVAFAGSSDLTIPGAYVRIDGPRIWIEFIVQPAIADPTTVHYHTIWRDKVADYGGAFGH